MKNSKRLTKLCFLLLFVTNFLNAQPTWEWARKDGTSKEASTEARAVVVDKSNNYYVAGVGKGSAAFGNSLLIAPNDFSYIFICRYDQQGTLVWRKSGFSAFGDVTVNAMEMDDNGNLFVIGDYFQSFNLEGVIVGATIFPDRDIFVAKFNSSGALLWVYNAGGKGEEKGVDLAIDPATQGVVFTGTFASFKFDFPGAFIGGPQFGAKGVENVVDNPANPANTDIFIARLNSGGILQTVTKGGGAGTDDCTSIVVDFFQSAYVTGHTEISGFIGSPPFFGGIQFVPFDKTDPSEVYIIKENVSSGVDFANFVSSKPFNFGYTFGRPILGFDLFQHPFVLINNFQHTIKILFDQNGKIIDDYFYGDVVFSSAGISKGKIVLAGEQGPAFGNSIIVERILSNGTEDFAIYGKDVISQTHFSHVFDHAISDDGSDIYIAGGLGSPVEFVPAGIPISLHKKGNSNVFVAKANSGEKAESPAQKMIIYPNPATQVINLNLPDLAENSCVDLTLVHSLSGEIALKKSDIKITTGKIIVEISGIPYGEYIATVTQGKLRYSERLYINR